LRRRFHVQRAKRAQDAAVPLLGVDEPREQRADGEALGVAGVDARQQRIREIVRGLTAEPAAHEGANRFVTIACAAGDEGACAELVAEHQRMVMQLAINLLGDRDEALDLSQEVFLRVFRTIHRFRGQSQLRTWIYRIVVNQARNRQRWWRRRHKSQQVSLDEHIRDHGELAESGDGRSPDRMLGQKQLAERIRVALEGLPFDQKTALVLREIDGLSYEDIATAMDCPVGTVRSRIFRAREAIDKKLKPLLD
jgi:RNA polymerase sigma-70 factor (ECF subfamily)